ncbi:MAG: hypothetical protein R2932_37985 [Caldilineaceae bacterium]
MRPTERIDEEVDHFYTSISTPVLSNVEIELTGQREDDILIDDLCLIHCPISLPGGS